MAHQRMSQFYESDQMHDRNGPMRRAYVQAEDLVREHPGYTALATFGAGLATGVAAAMLFLPRRRRAEEKSWYKHYLPESFSTERISQQVCEAVSHMLPNAVAHYFKKK
ncbi:MAG TPA: hypothetical protein VFW87_17175 [Pirellulales bacterium]|nr:hypothetical protein [Pirellulales bacterium]